MVTAAVWPTRRLVGVNFVVAEERLPLWVKAIDFIDRDVNLARAAGGIVAGVESDELQALAVLGWTAANIHRQPAELPIVDDHVWHVIVRGYGEPDQQADVFTTLLVYAGIPAYWQLVGPPPRELALSYVQIGGRWRVFDVAHGVVFRTAAGALATPEDLAADSTLIRRAAASRVQDLTAYQASFAGYRPPVAPDVLRADLQMTSRRFAFELRKLLHRQGRVWEIRSSSR